MWRHVLFSTQAQNYRVLIAATILFITDLKSLQDDLHLFFT